MDLEAQLANVIRGRGTIKRTTNKDGETVERQSSIYLASHQQWYPCLPTDNHFVYKTKNIGVSTMCTCGSASVVVGYGQYKKWSSWIGNEVLVCQSLVQYGRHADGSS